MAKELDAGELERMRMMYLHSKMKMVMVKDAEVVVPPAHYQDPTVKIVVPKGTTLTLLSLIPICVSSGQELKLALPVRVDKIPVNDDQKLTEREVAVPLEAMDIHPDEL